MHNRIDYHGHTIEMLRLLGYSKHDNGVCMGLAGVGVLAVLARNTKNHDARINLYSGIQPKTLLGKIINTHESWKVIVAEIKLKYECSKEQRLHVTNAYEILKDDEKLFLQARSFYEAIELIQRPENYSQLFHNDKKIKKIPQGHPYSYQILSSDVIDLQGGLCELTSYSGAYTEHEVNELMQSLDKLLKQYNIQSTIAFLLRSSNHAMTLGYDAKIGKWIFIEANNGQTEYINIDDLSSLICRWFFNSTYSIFTTIIYVNKNDFEELSTLFQQWKHERIFTRLHTINQRRATSVDNYNGSLLTLAVVRNDITLINDLIENGADCSNTHDNTNFPLILAVENGFIDIVKILLDQGVDVNQMRKTGSTALYIALQYGYLHITNLLIKYGADINLANNKGITPLLCAVAHNQYACVKELLEHPTIKINNFDFEYCQTALYTAASLNYHHIINLLMQHNADAEIANKNGITPLLCAIAHNHIESVQALLQNGISALLSEGKNVLIFTAANGTKEMINILLKYGAVIDQDISGSFSALGTSIIENRIEIANYLIQCGANIDLPSYKNMTPIFIAAWAGHNEIARLLIDLGSNIHTPSIDGVTPLYIAVFEGHTDLARMLLENGAEVDAPNDKGFTPLAVSVLKGNMEIVTLLLSYQADTNYSINGYTLFDIAKMANHIEIYNELINSHSEKYSFI